MSDVVIARCPDCGCEDYSYERLDNYICKMTCYGCGHQWRVLDPFDETHQVLDKSVQPGYWVVNIYQMSFIVRDITEAQKIIDHAKDMGYPVDKMFVNFARVLNAVTVIDELEWIDSVEEGHLDDPGDSAGCN